MIKSISLAILTGATLSLMTACNSGNSTVDSAKQGQEASKDKAQNDDDVFGAYVGLKNALVDGNAEKAKERAGNVKKQIASVKADKMTPDEIKDWNAQAAKLNADLDQIQGSTDLKGQRAAFSHLSDDLLVNIKKYGLAKRTVYHDFCPMYNNGANWLSETKEIKNPYYGKDMMECGVDSEEIAPAK